ncbi:MAG: hypothetical protein JSW11_00380 [Candidatus Heimdallarchaeota archaeon]|nr:MAG: hypothetical protein JSW11_00380 [Candidatus Heimdallarchaeota archaeon]
MSDENLKFQLCPCGQTHPIVSGIRPSLDTDDIFLCDCVQTGYVLYFGKNECEQLDINSPGEYVVEDAGDHGGWKVWVRKLNKHGKYCPNNQIFSFHQCDGYCHSLKSILVTRKMRRIFI